MVRRCMLSACVAAGFHATVSLAQTSAESHEKLKVATTTASFASGANALLALDQHRATVIDRIVTQWGDQLAISSAALKPDQLRTMLNGLRADQLLAASLAGKLDGLRNVLAMAVTLPLPPRDGVIPTKALGDTADDVTYTPVTPCRLVETRPGTFAAVYQGGGAFAAGEIRNYAIQGGNGVCLTQLPSGLNPSAVQLQVFGIPINSGASGDIEILPQGSTFGSTATEVFLGTELITSVSTTARINLANNQIGVQVRGAGAHAAIDVVGYFKAPSGSYFAQGGNAFGATASIGTNDNQPLEIKVNNQRAIRYEAVSAFVGANITGGHPSNVASGGAATVSGGGLSGTCVHHLGDRPCANQANDGGSIGGGYANQTSGGASNIAGGTGNTASAHTSTVGGGNQNTASGQNSSIGGGDNNTASGQLSTIPGGESNQASGDYSFAAGYLAHANANGCFVFSDRSQNNFTSCNFPNEFVARAQGGIYFFTGGTNDVNYTGAFLGPGSSTWATYSDRNGKENFVAVDLRAVLDALAAIPISTWNWKTENISIRHMGPMAQDFRAAFGLGADDRHITTVDISGVALAAIQGLHHLVREKDARIAALELKTESQRRELAELRKIVEVILAKTGGDTAVAIAR